MNTINKHVAVQEKPYTNKDMQLSGWLTQKCATHSCIDHVDMLEEIKTIQKLGLIYIPYWAHGCGKTHTMHIDLQSLTSAVQDLSSQQNWHEKAVNYEKKCNYFTE